MSFIARASAKSRSEMPLTSWVVRSTRTVMVHVEPLGVVVHTLGDQCGLRHEAERLDEVAEAKLFVKLAARKRPGGGSVRVELGERLVHFRAIQCPVSHGVTPSSVRAGNTAPISMQA